MGKRGISAVVATILLILIVVVGVGIVWKVILPLFAELEYLSYSDVQLNIVRQGFTVYDQEQNFAFVQIERGKDEVNVTGVEIGFSFGGTTKTYQSIKVPTPNGKYTYKFNFTNDSDMGIPQNVTPDKVTVAPIFTINNKLRLGKILDSEDMPVGRIHLTSEEWENANKEAATVIVVTTGPGGGEEPGEPVPPVEPTGPAIICNAENNSAYDNGTLIRTCEFGCDNGVCLPEPPIEWTSLTECTHINESGHYRLDANILLRPDVMIQSKIGVYNFAYCFWINRTSDVVFDMNEKGIVFDETFYNSYPPYWKPLVISLIGGISVEHSTNIEIYGGTIYGLMGRGIGLVNVNDSYLHDLYTPRQVAGLQLVGSNRNEFYNVTLSANQYLSTDFGYIYQGGSFTIQDSNDNTFDKSRFINAGYQTRISDQSKNNIFTDSSFTSCKGECLTIYEDAEATFIGGSFESFMGEGLRVHDATATLNGVSLNNLESQNSVIDLTDVDICVDSGGYSGLDIDGLSTVTYNNVVCDGDINCVSPCP